MSCPERNGKADCRWQELYAIANCKNGSRGYKTRISCTLSFGRGWGEGTSVEPNSRKASSPALLPEETGDNSLPAPLNSDRVCATKYPFLDLNKETSNVKKIFLAAFFFAALLFQVRLTTRSSVAIRLGAPEVSITSRWTVRRGVFTFRTQPRSRCWMPTVANCSAPSLTRRGSRGRDCLGFQAWLHQQWRENKVSMFDPQLSNSLRRSMSAKGRRHLLRAKDEASVHQ